MAKTEVHSQVSGEARHTLHSRARAYDSAMYCITVRGCLDTSWSEWFDGLAVTADCHCDETTLSGIVADQAALHGLLNKVRNLGLVLLRLNRVDADEADSRNVQPENLGSGDDSTH